MQAENRFLDFPIAIMKGFLDNPDDCLVKIYYYAVYKMVYSEDAEFESIDQFSTAFNSKPNTVMLESIKKKGSEIYNSFAGTKHVWTGIHIDTFRRFYLKDRSEFDLICLLTFIALKSIIQKDKVKRNISNEFLMSRMAGFEKKAAIDQIPDKILEYMNNKSKKKKHVFNTLEESYKVARPEKSRGITFSLSLSRKDIELEIMKRNYIKSDEFKEEKKRREKELAKAEFEKWKKSIR